MTQEEKAKAYDEALERAKVYKNHLIESNDDNGAVRELEYIFPELKESEDERIRKGLIQGFLEYESDYSYFKKLKVTDILTWLEKQGEPAEINPSEFNIRLQNLIGQFEELPKEELTSSLKFWTNVILKEMAVF